MPNLALTPAQAAQLTPHLRPGWTLLGKIEREQFDASNSQTCGSLWLECGAVPESTLPALRAAIVAAPAPAPLKPRQTAKQ